MIELLATMMATRVVAIQKGPYRSGRSPRISWNGGVRISADRIRALTSS
jgi:hypothetical protein